MKFFHLICTLSLFSYHAFASDTIIVFKDARVDVLCEKQSSINQLTSHMTSNGMYKGFRLQLLVSQSREDAFRMKANLLQNFPDQKSYVLYQSPYFKVRLGNFITRDEAEKFKETIASQYSSQIYIVEDGVEYTQPQNLNN